ncbi:hypothetical protein [Sphingomonas melonis]|uniref:ABC-type phosphate transport system auxiliary subunit n=1 Tax=Sphingomonas melonis TaxID=152682 RepID=A0A7Y9FRI7_9SPHN|nr:hypothetical protein [Sphingomonas melonis]NYD92114.1 ABC-type phosphate transport system auxiliary subunit [Sphingomonas melonis]
MILSPVALSSLPSPDPALATQLATLAAGLDDRFLAAGATLAHAVDAIQRVITALDGVTLAIDDDTAAAAVGDFKAIAQRLTALPVTQARRDADLAGIDRQADAIRAQVLEMRATLRLLAIYGPNIKIAASGEPIFLTFVDNMLARLAQGEQHLTQILSELSKLTEGMASGRQSASQLLAECARVVPEVPDRLERNAADLEAYLTALKAVARRVAAVAREIEGRIAVALNALQIGDITRQRLEHVVAMLTMIDGLALADAADAATVAAHIQALAAAQTEALAGDFEQDAARLVHALASLGDETRSLLDVISEHERGGSGGVLTSLDHDVSEISDLTQHLLEADSRANAMVDMTTSAVSALAERFEGLRLIRRDVQDIAVNTRLLCGRFGMMGRAVAVIAVEVGACAVQLDDATRQIGTAMTALSQAGQAIADAQRDQGAGSGDRLAHALAAVHAGCGRSERGVRDGGNDARALIDALDTAGGDLSGQLAVGSAIRAAGERLSVLGNRAPDKLSDAADAALRDLLQRIAASYTMASERDVHAGFLLPGMAIAVAEAIDDDGLF